MKKLLILSLFAFLPACACTGSDSENYEEPASQVQTYNESRVTDTCNLNDGSCNQRRIRYNRYAAVDTTEGEPYYQRTTRRARIYEPDDSYRIVRRTRRYVEPQEDIAPIIIQRPAPAPQPMPAPRIVEYQNDQKAPCKGSVKETREPVEIVYKKTTTRTVYEPKVYTDVSYEKEPYTAANSTIETIVQEKTVNEYIDSSGNQAPAIMLTEDRK